MVKKALEQHGYAFRSETDTEVVVQLIDYIRTDTGCTLFEAVREACHQIVGSLCHRGDRPPQSQPDRRGAQEQPAG